MFAVAIGAAAMALTSHWVLFAIFCVLGVALSFAGPAYIRRQVQKARENGVELDWNRAQWRRDELGGKLMAVYALGSMSILLLILVVWTAIKAT
jgi:hypothetical protein